MVSEDTYCVDILKQAFAVERALKKLRVRAPSWHLSTCGPTGFKECRKAAMIAELSDLFELARK